METISSNHDTVGVEIRNWLDTSFASFIATGDKKQLNFHLSMYPYALLIEKSLGNSLKRDLLALNARGESIKSRERM